MKCARTACQKEGAICEHTDNGNFYCVKCAKRINKYHKDLNPVGTPPLVKIPAYWEHLHPTFNKTPRK